MSKHESDFYAATPTVNVVEILRVADAIERAEVPGLGFNMGDYYQTGGIFHDQSGNECGTTACIAGWAAVLAGLPVHKICDSSIFATELFGLSYADSVQLFLASGSPVEKLRDITRPMAVRTLRHLAATGIVDWNLPEA